MSDDCSTAWPRATVHISPDMSEVEAEGPGAPLILGLIEALRSDLRDALKDSKEVYAEYFELKKRQEKWEQEHLPVYGRHDFEGNPIARVAPSEEDSEVVWKAYLFNRSLPDTYPTAGAAQEALDGKIEAIPGGPREFGPWKTHGKCCCHHETPRYHGGVVVDTRELGDVRGVLGEMGVKLDEGGTSDEGGSKALVLAEEAYFQDLAKTLTGLLYHRVCGDLGRDVLQPELTRCLRDCVEDPALLKERVGWGSDEWERWRQGEAR